MPALPKFGDGPGQKWFIKIVHKVYSEQQCRTLSYQRVAKKISINLKCKTCCGEPCRQGVVMCRRSIKCINYRCQIICYTYFKKKAIQHQPESVLKVLINNIMPFEQLTVQRTETLNRTSHQMREESNVTGKFNEISLWNHLSAVYIHDITYALKCIKRNTCRNGISAQLNKPSGCIEAIHSSGYEGIS